MMLCCCLDKQMDSNEDDDFIDGCLWVLERHARSSEILQVFIQFNIIFYNQRYVLINDSGDLI